MINTSRPVQVNEVRTSEPDDGGAAARRESELADAATAGAPAPAPAEGEGEPGENAA